MLYQERTLACPPKRSSRNAVLGQQLFPVKAPFSKRIGRNSRIFLKASSTFIARSLAPQQRLALAVAASQFWPRP